MIRVPSPYPDRDAFPAALIDYAPALTRLHRLAAKTAWLIDADTLYTEAARDTARRLASFAASLGTLRRDLGDGDATAAYEGLRDRLAPIGACANALRRVILERQLSDRLAEIAVAVACLDQAMVLRMTPRPAGTCVSYPPGATVAAWRERFPDWALIADGWIMRTV